MALPGGYRSYRESQIEGEFVPAIILKLGIHTRGITSMDVVEVCRGNYDGANAAVAQLMKEGFLHLVDGLWVMKDE